MRLLPLSATHMWPSLSIAMPCGSLNCPLPFPLDPNCAMYSPVFPLSANSCTRLLPRSTTYASSPEITIPADSLNWPLPLPSWNAANDPTYSAVDESSSSSYSLVTHTSPFASAAIPSARTRSTLLNSRKYVPVEENSSTRSFSVSTTHTLPLESIAIAVGFLNLPVVVPSDPNALMNVPVDESSSTRSLPVSATQTSPDESITIPRASLNCH